MAFLFEDPYQQYVSTICSTHKDNLNLFYPFKFIKEVGSYLTTFKKNFIYGTGYFTYPFDSTKDIFSFAKPFLNKVIKHYKKIFLDGEPIIKGKYYLFVIKEDEIIASYMISIDHKNDKILNWKKQDGEIIKGDICELRIAVDVYRKFEDKYKIEETCAICFEVKPNVLYDPCNHLSTCERCNNIGDIDTCPICRTPIRCRISLDIPL